MRIQSREQTEQGRERVELVPETLDDLWHLTYVRTRRHRLGRYDAAHPAQRRPDARHGR